MARPPRAALGLVLTGALGSAACQHDESTAFPPGLSPVGSDPVPAPSGSAGDEYPQTLALTQGSGSAYNYVTATGYVDAPITTVWAAFKIPSVVVDRHGITSYSVEEDVEKGYDVSFLTAYTIDSIETVNFSLTWREGVVAGTEAAPTRVSVVYQKTEGSSFVSLMAGSIELVAVTPTVTLLQFVQHMNAVETSSSNIASWTNEMFASVVAQVNGKPLP